MNTERLAEIEARRYAALKEPFSTAMGKRLVRQDIPDLTAALREAWEQIEIMSAERKAMDESLVRLEAELHNRPKGFDFDRVSDG